MIFSNGKLIEELHQQWLKDPASVDASWRSFFEGYALGSSSAVQTNIVQGDSGKIISSERSEGSSAGVRDARAFIEAYRHYGHTWLSVSHLGMPKVPKHLLDPAEYGFLDPKEPVLSGGVCSEKIVPFSALESRLKEIYCSWGGVEYMHLVDKEPVHWLQSQLERNEFKLSQEEELGALRHLVAAELFEKFLHTKFVGQKRFSLEGLESLIPLLHNIAQKASLQGAQKVVMGMAHRGRLNVLANFAQKPMVQIFTEFLGVDQSLSSWVTGDVKYHLGYDSSLQWSNSKIDIHLLKNPSHLESVNPVIEGFSRALQEKMSGDFSKVLPLVIHGDAAVAGQGIVYEVLARHGIEGYETGGTLHIIANNHIGFTTEPEESRSTEYCSAIAQAFGAPVFHVNASNMTSVLRAASLAIAMRQRFGVDVFIDLCGYRKHGHNETDEPRFTNPLYYHSVGSVPLITEVFSQELQKKGTLSPEEGVALTQEVQTSLERAHQTALASLEENKKKMEQSIRHCVADVEVEVEQVQTAVPEETLKCIGQVLFTPPEGKNFSAKVSRLLEQRRQSLSGSMDWGVVELLTYATLVKESIPLRLSGQDVGRGTFSHRQSVWVDQEDGSKIFSLSAIAQGKSFCAFRNSPLSEYGVLGFEYGYSLACPDGVTIWEAQFGDFFNGAQIIIDQYIASAEAKWGQYSGLVLYLPHGYEGQGPEHSSARVERFLQLCARSNICVANVTTPAQLFHLIRRQAYCKVKRPLVVFTPKMLLRYPACKSTMAHLSAGSFESCLEDDLAHEGKVSTMAFCSGKFYYQLVEERNKRGRSDIVFIRIEQLYPLEEKKIQQVIQKYSSATTFLWVQEEPRNMGAWSFIQTRLSNLVGPLYYRGRKESAGVAAGFRAVHDYEHALLMKELFEGTNT